MICSQDDASCSHINHRKIQEHIEHCNLAWILFIKHITVTFVVAHGPLTSINQACASILAVVYVLLGRAVTEYRWGGSRNILFMRHKFVVLRVKKLLKSVYIYGSYRKIKSGVSLFLDHPVDELALSLRLSRNIEMCELLYLLDLGISIKYHAKNTEVNNNNFIPSVLWPHFAAIFVRYDKAKKRHLDVDVYTGLCRSYKPLIQIYENIRTLYNKVYGIKLKLKLNWIVVIDTIIVITFNIWHLNKLFNTRAHTDRSMLKSDDR